MELNEAINIINNFRTWYMGGDISNDVLQEIYKSIDTVLEELNNRIPRKDIEDKIEETQQEIEVIKKQEDNIKNGMKILFREGYIENLETLKRIAIKKLSTKLEDYERIIELMKPSIDILRKRDGKQLIKVECAINNIIEYYDKLNREV